jgi:hypothetical protein
MYYCAVLIARNMLNQLFLFELFTSILLIRNTGIGVVESLLRAVIEGKRMESDQDATKNASYLTPDPGDDEGENP